MRPFAFAVVLALGASSGGAQGLGEPPEPTGTADAAIDLQTREGVALVKGTWRYADARIVETDFHAAGADGQPTGASVRTNEIEPHAGAAEFDDSGWEALDPVTLQDRRGHGRLSFNWYRIAVTIPDRVGAFETRGASVVFETSLDDYAEVWVDGELPRRAGQSGGSVVKGWNAANRLVVGRGVRPGQKLQIAVFGANGPLSSPPTNFIWMRLAKLSFYAGAPAGPYAVEPHEVNVEALRVTTGSGNDQITGGLGADTINAGAGNDTLFVTAAGEVVAGEVYDGGAGTGRSPAYGVCRSIIGPNGSPPPRTRGGGGRCPDRAGCGSGGGGLVRQGARVSGVGVARVLRRAAAGREAAERHRDAAGPLRRQRSARRLRRRRRRAAQRRLRR